jgi:hypothetical protein
MKKVLASIAITFASYFALPESPAGPARVYAAAGDEHAYFEALQRRADLWKAWSLRDPAQLISDSLGGFATGPVAEAKSITYSPEMDTDRRRQDAAKIVIPAFLETTVLTRSVSSTDTVLPVVIAPKGQLGSGRVIKIDNELMRVTEWSSETTAFVQRAQFGTSAAPHNAGAVLVHATNSLKTQIRLPLGTEDGHSYFFTWDGYWTDSFMSAGGFNHKAFQFTSGSRDGDAIFFEPNVAYGGDRQSCFDPSRHVGALRVRAYNKVGGGANWSATDGTLLGPGATNNFPLSPHGDFCYAPNQWVRFFLHIRQRANDYDYVDMWAADETQEPVQVLVNIPISVRGDGRTPNSISKFWIEFNTSDDEYYRRDNRELVAYVRNFAALRDPGDIRSLLVRPTPGAKPVLGPAAPRNVRIISGP